nr:ABC transporter substrate-binding protein [uncultured Cohaesibacter sp.]
MKKLPSFLGALVVAACTISSSMAADLGTVRIAQDDNGAADLIRLIAYANAEKRGVDIELNSLKSDAITFQAVLNGQVDIGVGDSYEMIANLKAPIRNIFQARKLAYIPVVDKTVYPDWKSLDGHQFAVHSRGSGTETLAQIMEKNEGIEFSQITYLPGSSVRVGAMQRGNIKATYLDIPNAKVLINSDPDRFGQLPANSQNASDSTLYARQEFLSEHADAVNVILEELLKAIRATNADPSWPASQREALDLLPDLSDQEVAAITPYFEETTELGIFPADGGGETAAKADIDFLQTAGKLSADVTPELFWDYAPLNKALAAVK